MRRNVYEAISASLSEDDWKILLEFYIKVQRLISTKIVSDNQAEIKLELNYNHITGLSSETKLPPEEQIAEFIMAFRFFYLQKEKSFLPRVLNILGKHSTNPETRNCLKVYRKRWQDPLEKDVFKFRKNNGKDVTPSLLLDWWLNAYYFHTDKDKRKELKKLADDISENAAKCLLLDVIYEETKIILDIFKSIKQMVEDHFNIP